MLHSKFFVLDNQAVTTQEQEYHKVDKDQKNPSIQEAKHTQETSQTSSILEYPTAELMQRCPICRAQVIVLMISYHVQTESCL